MNYTENYHLPQWEETDRIMRVDFNEAMSSLEEGITVAKEVADAAQATANAAYSPDQKPYVAGSYTGTGHMLDISLGFRPSFVIVSSSEAFSNTILLPAIAYCGQTGGTAIPRAIQITDTGFRILEPESVYPHLGDHNRVYDYIAFR